MFRHSRPAPDVPLSQPGVVSASSAGTTFDPRCFRCSLLCAARERLFDRRLSDATVILAGWALH